MKKYRRIAMIMCSVGLMFLLTGVTYSFFNYTKTGNANVFSTGDISFNTDEGESITLTNVFPMSESEASAANLDTLTIGISGSTTYTSGEEFLISIVDVTKINNKEIPMSYIATYEATTGNSIGIEEADYFTERESKSANIYLLNENGWVKEDKQVLVGFIKGGTAGIDGTLTIKPYVDAERIIITDTPETIPDLTIGKTVISTTEWNSLKGNNAISFKIKAESNPKLWVEEPEPDNVTPEACFDKRLVTYYILNSNMNQTELNDCIDYIDSLNIDFDNNGTSEDYCLGTGTSYGETFQYYLEYNDSPNYNSDYLVEHNIVIPEIGLRLESYDSNCGSDIIIPNKMSYVRLLHNSNITSEVVNTCVNYFIQEWGPEVEGDTINVGETYQSFCNGTGTILGATFQEWLNNDRFNATRLAYLKSHNIIIDGENIDYNVLVIGSYFYSGGITSLVFNKSLKKIGYDAFAIGSNNIIPDEIIIPASVRFIGTQAFRFYHDVSDREYYGNKSFIIQGKPYIKGWALPAYETITYNGTCQELYDNSDSNPEPLIIYNDNSGNNPWNVITTDTNTCLVRDGYA